MGRYRNTKSNDDYGRGSEKGRKQNNKSRYDDDSNSSRFSGSDSDHSSFFSDLEEDSHGDNNNYNRRSGGRSRRLEGGGGGGRDDRRSGSRHRKDYPSDSDHDSYAPTPKSKSKKQINNKSSSSYREERTRSNNAGTRSRSRSRSRNDDDDSENSDASDLYNLYDLAKRTLDRSRSHRSITRSNNNKSRPRSRSRGVDSDSQSHSDSDHSDLYNLAKRALDRPSSSTRSDRNLGSAGKHKRGSEDRGGGNFSSKIERIRNKQEDSSFGSDEESESRSTSYDALRSSRHIGNKAHRSSSRKPASESNLMQQTKPRSRQPLTRSMSQKSTGLNSENNMQMQMTAQASNNNSQAMQPSTSVRNTGQTFFPGQQSPASGLMANNNPLLNHQGQGQRMAGMPGGNNHLQGNTNHPQQRVPSGPGNMMRSMSGRSINTFATFSSPQVQRNRSNPNQNNDIAQSPMKPRPGIMRGNSQRSLGNANNLVLDKASIQRQGLMRAGSNRSLGNPLQRPGLNRAGSNRSLGNPLQQRPGMTRTASNRSLGNSDALRNTPINSQRTGFLNGAPKGTLGNNNDRLPNTPMNYQQSGMIRIGSQNNLVNSNALLNSKSMYSQRPGVMRGSSQRSLGNNNVLLNAASSAQYNPNMRSENLQLSYIGMNNAQRSMSSTKPTSIAGDSVLVMSGVSIHGNSVMSTSGVSVDTSVMSTRSLRSSPPQSLADQIYSRSRHSRQSDTQSLASYGTYGDPPGVDSNHFSNKKRSKAYSDDVSFKTFQDDQESYVTSNDPPDKFDDDQSCRDVTRDKPDPDEGSRRSYESSDDRQSFYSEDDSVVSNFDDDDKNSYTKPLSRKTADADDYRQESGGSVSADSVNSDSSRGRRNKRAPGKSPSRFSSDLAFEFDREMSPPERTPSFKYRKVADSNKKDKEDVVAKAPQQEPLNWLAQQISTRKSTDMNVSSQSLEPAGAITDDQACSYSENSTSEDSYSKNSTFENNYDDIIASDGIGHSSNILGMLRDTNASKRGHNAVLNQHSDLPSELDYVLKYSISDALLISSASTTTTDTMTQEVPSVILSRQGPEKDLYSDVDSLLSSPEDEDESTTTNPRTRVAIKYEKKRTDSLIQTNMEKLSPRSSKKKSHSGESSRIEKKSKKKYSKKTANKKNGRNDEVSKEVKKRAIRDTLKEERSKKKNMDLKMKSSKKKKDARKRRNKDSDEATTNNGSAARSLDPSELEEPQKSAARVYLKSVGTESWISEYEMPKKDTRESSRTPLTGNTVKQGDEKTGFEDQSVMNLIDRLKSFELYG